MGRFVVGNLLESLSDYRCKAGTLESGLVELCETLVIKLLLDVFEAESILKYDGICNCDSCAPARWYWRGDGCDSEESDGEG